MTQTAQNEEVTLSADTWTLISEVNCTFVVNEGAVEILGMDGATPDSDDTGILYRTGQGEDSETDTLARYPGAGTADRIYAISRGRDAKLFVSRESVA